jgi:hypothetical protein
VVKPNDEKDLVPMKVRRATLRILKTLAAWREMTLIDYLDDMVSREGGADIRRMVEEITQLEGEDSTTPTASAGKKARKGPE